MSIFDEPVNEANMYKTLGGLLFPDEKIECAIYCLFRQTGFFASNKNITYGYVALTSEQRLIGHKMTVLESLDFAEEMKQLTKITVKESIFGYCTVNAFFETPQRHQLKFLIHRKIYGSSAFPNQTKNADTMLDLLKKYELSY
ncbi:MAG: hypothetical protein IKS17_08680 [Firmicutes bacterium]|nr:hypothetical protein [Bacillota bacterium]